MTSNDEITKAARSLAGQRGGSRRLYRPGHRDGGLPPGVEFRLSELLALVVTGPMLLGFSAFVLAPESSGEASLGGLFGGFDGFG